MQTWSQSKSKLVLDQLIHKPATRCIINMIINIGIKDPTG
jgi:hypothetical protein